MDKIIWRYEVLQDYFCEQYLHEIANYYRSGIQEKKLLKGDIVEFKEEWYNLYGRYLKVIKDNITYDIKPDYLERISNLKLTSNG